MTVGPAHDVRRSAVVSSDLDHLAVATARCRRCGPRPRSCPPLVPASHTSHLLPPRCSRWGTATRGRRSRSGAGLPTLGGMKRSALVGRSWPPCSCRWVERPPPRPPRPPAPTRRPRRSGTGDGTLRKGCHGHRYGYAVVVPAGDSWALEVFLVDRRGKTVSFGYETTGGDPKKGQGRFQFCAGRPPPGPLPGEGRADLVALLRRASRVGEAGGPSACAGPSARNWTAPVPPIRSAPVTASLP